MSYSFPVSNPVSQIARAIWGYFKCRQSLCGVAAGCRQTCGRVRFGAWALALQKCRSRLLWTVPLQGAYAWQFDMVNFKNVILGRRRNRNRCLCVGRCRPLQGATARCVWPVCALEPGCSWCGCRVRHVFAMCALKLLCWCHWVPL